MRRKISGLGGGVSMGNKIIVTIARQYGTGGLKIGKRLAEELGINCYDSEMFRLVSTNESMHSDLVAHDSRIKGTALFTIAKEKYDSHPDEDLPEFGQDLVVMKNLYEYQSEIIRELADRESCVIVGRSSNYILKDRPDVLSVFIHAPMEFRIKRASSVHNMTDKELESYIQSVDQKKQDYYHYYTGEDWRDVTQYDLSLNSYKLGIQGCIDMIKKMIKVKQEEVTI